MLLLLAIAASLAQGAQWLDADGVKSNPIQVEGKKGAVLLYIATDCPIANRYAPELKTIIDKYSPKGIRFSMVYEDGSGSAEAIKRHARDYGYRCRLILDPTHTLAQRGGATVTPEAVVIGPKDSIVYRGRIDDKIVAYGKERPKPRRHDLRLALDALLQGKPIPSAPAVCIGCVIPTPPHSKPNERERARTQIGLKHRICLRSVCCTYFPVMQRRDGEPL